MNLLKFGFKLDLDIKSILHLKNKNSHVIESKK